MKGEAERSAKIEAGRAAKAEAERLVAETATAEAAANEAESVAESSSSLEVPSVSETKVVAEEVLDAAVPDDVTVEPTDENDVLSVEDQTINGDLAIGASSSSPLEGEVPIVSEAEGGR